MDRELDRDVAGCAAAHQRLLAALDPLVGRPGDDPARRPSLVPGWTVGHVLTHLARQADSQIRVIDGAERGEVVEAYEGGLAARAAAIEAGSPRGVDELVDDLRRSIWRLEQRWATTTEVGWAGSGLTPAGPVAVVELPFRRWREVEVHHADLGLGYGPADWPAEYVRVELQRMSMLWASRRPMGMTELPEAAMRLAPHERLAWLLGRAHPAGLPDAGLLG